MNIRAFFLTLLCLLYSLSASAYTERFHVITDDEGNRHCRTNKVNITNERDPFYCTITFADRIDGKPSASLCWEIPMTTNANSRDFCQHILAITKDLMENEGSQVALSLYLSNGDRLYFDGSSLAGFTKSDWHPLIHVSRESGELVAFLMFPLEYCWSDKVQLGKSAKKRYKYIIDQLQKHNITSVAYTDFYRNVRIEGEFRLARPTADTFKAMVKKCRKRSKQKE